jgi:hypothetical protein
VVEQQLLDDRTRSVTGVIHVPDPPRRAERVEFAVVRARVDVDTGGEPPTHDRLVQLRTTSRRTASPGTRRTRASIDVQPRLRALTGSGAMLAR